MLGIDAPATGTMRVHFAHILYQRIDDDAVTGKVLGYVMAHVIWTTRMAGDAAASGIRDGCRHSSR